MKKICSVCKEEKEELDFWRCSRRKDGRARLCKICQYAANQASMIKNHGDKYAYHSEYRRKITALGKPNILYSKKKHNAKSQNIDFNISLEEFSEWYIKTPKRCFYCDITQEDVDKNRSKMPGANKCRLTLDRKNNNLGYVKDNIVLACSRCNLIKSNFFSSDEMREIGQKYVKPQWN